MGQTWEKKPPIKPDDLHIGCLNCSTAALVAPMDMIVAVGFGCAQVTKDNEVIYQEHDGEEYKSVQQFEDMARQDPDHDWRIEKFGPMHGEDFQRQGDDNWVCIESNMGFA